MASGSRGGEETGSPESSSRDCSPAHTPFSPWDPRRILTCVMSLYLLSHRAGGDLSQQPRETSPARGQGLLQGPLPEPQEPVKRPSYFPENRPWKEFSSPDPAMRECLGARWWQAGVWHARLNHESLHTPPFSWTWDGSWVIPLLGSSP